MKSKYPEKIDTSEELEIIKNNLTKLRAEVFNSYRSAIIQIEKTLGINPQGIEGSTVSARLNTSLDELGNIKEEALQYLNLLSGPISNTDVKDDANISENKLNLNFSTNFLYNQIFALKRLIDEIDKFLEDINSKLAAHLVVNAPNRHSSRSISVAERTASSVGSSSALMSLDNQELQSFLELIIFNHVKYDGSSISSENRSHSADQIFFNNSDVQDLISAKSVQRAIEDIVSADAEYLRSVILNLSTNSKIRSGSISDPKNSSDAVLIKSVSATVASIYGKKRIDLTLSSPLSSSEKISKLDFIDIDGLEISKFNKRYYSYDSYESGETSITIYGTIDKSLEGSTVSLNIYKNNYSDYNKAGMTLSARYRSNYSGIVNVIATDPNSSSIISSGIRPYEINSSNNELSITIDESDSHTIDIFDSSIYSNIGISLESIIERINKYASEEHLPITASKVRTEYQDELCISHLVPNISGDLKNRSLKITSSNAINSLGLSDAEDIAIYGTGSNSIVSNGRIIGEHFEHSFLENYTITPGSGNIERTSGSFVTEGIKNGDMLFVDGASFPDDNGCFVIKRVEDLTIEVDFTFTGTNSSSTQALILKNTATLEDFVFDELSVPDIVQSQGSMFFDIYYNEKDFSLFLDKNLEITGLPNSASPIMISIDNLSENILSNGEELELQIDSNMFAKIIENPSSSAVQSDPVKIVSSGIYTIYTKDKSKFINIIVSIPGAPPSSPTSIMFYGKRSKMGRSLKIGSFLFSNTVGKVFGAPGQTGIPLFLNTMENGTTSEKNISDSFITNKINLPMFESMGNGVSFGLKKSGSHTYDSSAGTLEISIGGGIVYISGRRISFEPKSNAIFQVSDATKKYYLTIDKYGKLSLKEEVSSVSGYSGYSPSYGKEEITIGVFDPVLNTYKSIFPKNNSIFEKSDKTIYVSPSYSDENQNVVPSERKSHFSSIEDAVNYAKYASKISGGSYTPKVCLLDGYHYISSTIEVDFSIEIFGLSKDTFIVPQIGSGISLQSGDISLSSTVLSKENSVFYISEMSSGQKFSLKDITFKYSAGTDIGLVAGVLFGYNSSSSDNDNIELSGLRFECTSCSYSSNSNYKIFIPIVFQELDGSVVKTGQSFKNVNIENCYFNNLKTSGYSVLIFTNGGSNTIRNFCCKSNTISGNRASSAIYPETQVLGCASTIEVISTRKVFHTSSFSTINVVYEEDTVEV